MVYTFVQNTGISIQTMEYPNYSNGYAIEAEFKIRRHKTSFSKFRLTVYIESFRVIE